VRLHRLKARYGDQIEIERRAFPLRPGPDRSVQFLGTKREVSWQRIKAMVEPEGIIWNMWQRDDYPNWSLPGLEAAKCAALQSQDAYDEMHFRLFRGFFEQGVNIANVDEVLTLARQSPLLDYSRFIDDFDSGITRRAVFDEYEAAVNDYLVYAIPTVIFPNHERVVGAVPIEAYEKVLETFGVT
jgi:predicted DsbA family dithiol-disulfide isomerase